MYVCANYYTPFTFLLYHHVVMEEWKMFRGSVFYEMWLACDNLEERAELWQAIMEYWMFWKEPPQKFKRDFVNVRFILDKSKTLKQKRSDAWKQHTGNQYTQWDTKWKAQKTPVEQMEQAGTNGTNKNKKENKNIKEENIKKKYLDFVLLSDEEYWKLLNIFWKERLDKEIQKLNNYIGSSWKKYKSHYFTIRQWNQEFIQELEKRKKETETIKQDLPSEEWLLWTITLKR